MTPEFHPAAEEELAVAVKVGETRGSGLGGALLNEIRRATTLLCATPYIGERLDREFSRLPLRRFPFGLIYRVDGDRIRILAVAHRRQRPGYWRSRD